MTQTVSGGRRTWKIGAPFETAIRSFSTNSHLFIIIFLKLILTTVHLHFLPEMWKKNEGAYLGFRTHYVLEQVNKIRDLSFSVLNV